MGFNLRAMLVWGAILLTGCPVTSPDDSDTDSETGPVETGDTEPTPTEKTVVLQVTLDGIPAQKTLVVQAGTRRTWVTNENGQAECVVDLTVPGGDIYLAASHPEARIGSVKIDEAEESPLQIDLVRYEPDNPDYEFGDPGTPERRESSAQCAHCHLSINQSWYDSPHRTSASNPTVQDLYAGAAHALNTSALCEAAGGQWMDGLEPGTGEVTQRCYIGDGALPALNSDCGITDSCDTKAMEYGECANCHAPAINGQLGGRHLLDATGLAYDYGIHCDFCHKVSDVHLNAPPGNEGSLVITRPSELAKSPAFGKYEPLSFGPYHDVLTSVMGAVQRDHFVQSRFCAGCHEHNTVGMQSSEPIDTNRWPEGQLPIQSTYSEWTEGPFFEVQPCQACHMPPDPTAGNAADLYQAFDLRPGLIAGWERPTGTVRHHSWVGPRQKESGMLEIAAAVFLDVSREDDVFRVKATVKNVGPGHALPTGEPMRSMVLLVQTTCDGVTQSAIGGDVVPGFGGYLERKTVGEDWVHWSQAKAGDHILVIRREEGFRNYDGPGRFGLDGFTATEKGLPLESYVGSSRIVGLSEAGVILNQELPDGDIAYLLPNDPWPEEDSLIGRYAGRPGMAFARVLTNEAGVEMVPHFLASDIAIDNRLKPQQSWTSTHDFSTTCATPIAHARLIYRSYPPQQNTVKQWNGKQRIMVEASR